MEAIPRSSAQVCLKFGHAADRCWHQFEEDYVPEERNASAAMNSYSIDNTWYTDMGATDHITGELEKLVVREKYNGRDQIHTTSNAGTNIRHIGHSTICTLFVTFNFVTFFMFLPPKIILF
jgi:hypothetical protein